MGARNSHVHVSTTSADVVIPDSAREPSGDFQLKVVANVVPKTLHVLLVPNTVTPVPTQIVRISVRCQAKPASILVICFDDKRTLEEYVVA